jgi:hypothetical protein
MMKVIGISSITADPNGDVLIEPNANTKMKANSRRVSRTKTLDGGVVITDSGYTDGDRTLEIHSNVTRVLWDKIWAIFKSYTLVYVATEDGFYSAAIEAARYEENEAVLTILVKERLDV